MGLIDNINYYYHDFSDPRLRDWFLMDSIWYPIVIILIYLPVVFKLAPAYMKNRPAYKLNTYIKCYNLCQVVVNAYMVINFSSCYPFLRTFECRPIIYTVDACSILIIKTAYFGVWIKLIDLSETVIYILRKKNNQVSFLHLYHHISTFLLGLICTKYLSSEVVLLYPILNCSVHVMMYSYYFLSNFHGPIKQMIIPLKRYLTLIQMGQFIILIVQIASTFLQDCEVPKPMIIIMLFNLLINFWLFFRFYKKTYIDSKKKRA